MNAHQKITIDQCTLQAEPFAHSPGHINEESIRLLAKIASLSESDTVLDIAAARE